MYPYIVCFTCGRVIGDIYDAFLMMRAAKQAATQQAAGHDIDPDFLFISEDTLIDLSDVFDQLRITSMCCKIRLNTQVEFKNIY